MKLNTRQLRYQYLREKCGFLAFEALALSKVAWNQKDESTGDSICPYMLSGVIAPRRRLYTRYWHDKRRTQQTQERWIAHIMKTVYTKNNWFDTKEVIKNGLPKRFKKPNPWQQLKAAEKRFRLDAGPQYESPHIKRHRDMAKTKRLIDKKLGLNQQSQRDIEKQILGESL